jgi:hypothetical protein
MVSKSAIQIADRLSRNDRQERLTRQVKFWTSPSEHSRLTTYAEENGMGEGAAIRRAISLMLDEVEEE